MDARIADSLLSVIVFTQDVVPDTVAESKSSSVTIRRYLDKGGKVVWYGDVPMYYQGHSDGTRTTWSTSGASSVLGFNAAGGTWDVNQPVAITVDGATWGLQEPWSSVRPALPTGLRVLARDANNNAAAWVRHYTAKDVFRGFVRFSDRAAAPNASEIQALAEYVPAVPLGDNLLDNIIMTFHYPWYANPAVSGSWFHWGDAGYSPPSSWTSNYLPSYPDAAWNPSVQLYDSNDPNAQRWQDRAMARTGIDIAAASWWGISTREDIAFGKVIRVAKSVQWCIYYELDSVGDPTPQKIHNDIKYVIDNYAPTRNYARINGKWLVTVYAVSGTAAADRWRQAKVMLAASGYPVYLNGDVGDPSPATAPDPWDAIHRYNPVAYQTLTSTADNVDDSASVAPGFWKIGESPRLNRSLTQFTSAWNNVTANHEKARFMFLETWNEWHEGTQIEPGQEIIADAQNGFVPAGYDYAHDFIDAIAPMANTLRWQSVGHRPDAPVRLEAEQMVWELGTAAEGMAAWRIRQNGSRIGSAVHVTAPEPAAWLVVRARAVRAGQTNIWPRLLIYWDDAPVGDWTVGSTDWKDYRAILNLAGGIHKVELTMAGDPGGVLDVDVIVDFAEVYFTTPGGDFDGDGIPDAGDNCPAAANALQQDDDGDELGDVCDNCPAVANSDQSDIDADAIGDACDNCPNTPNGDQADSDGDLVGDLCDACPGTVAGAQVDETGCPLPLPGDFDRDGDVDLADFGLFQICFNGPNRPTSTGCGMADFDSDTDVDLGDFATFQTCFTAPNRRPGCQ